MWLMIWGDAVAKNRKKDAFFSVGNLRSLATLLILIFAFRWSVAAPYHVPTPSMEPSIKVGDRVLGNHLAYQLRLPFTKIVLVEWARPQRGDIIIFDSKVDPGTNLVKRVIGVEGDTIEFRGNVLHVNGVARPLEEYAKDRSILADIVDHQDAKDLYLEASDGRKHWVMFDAALRALGGSGNWPSSGLHTVEKGHVFTTGDNRNNSSDSRVWGDVPMESIYGNATRVIWSVYFPGETWLPRFRFDRFGQKLI